MPKIYFYKLTADNGGAPCVQDGLLSLAICKPMIRDQEQGFKAAEVVRGILEHLQTRNLRGQHLPLYPRARRPGG